MRFTKSISAAAMRLTLLVALALPGLAWAGDHCDSISVTAGAIRNRADIQAFVECAYDYVKNNGTEEAARAFRADERWLSDSIYVFVDQRAPKRRRTCSRRIRRAKGSRGGRWSTSSARTTSSRRRASSTCWAGKPARGAGCTTRSRIRPPGGASRRRRT